MYLFISYTLYVFLSFLSFLSFLCNESYSEINYTDSIAVLQIRPLQITGSGPELQKSKYDPKKRKLLYVQEVVTLQKKY